MALIRTTVPRNPPRRSRLAGGREWWLHGRAPRDGIPQADLPTPLGSLTPFMTWALSVGLISRGNSWLRIETGSDA